MCNRSIISAWLDLPTVELGSLDSIYRLSSHKLATSQKPLAVEISLSKIDGFPLKANNDDLTPTLYCISLFRIPTQ